MSDVAAAVQGSQRAKRLALAAAVLGSSVASLDASIVNVALPAIERDLGGGLAAQQWVSNAYLLALGSLVLVGGSLGDIYGQRRIFALGVGAFGVLSAACALAPTIDALIAARALLQGVAAALLAPSSLAVIVTAFPPAERGGAVGTWTAWSGIAGVFGPFAGGAIVDHASWRVAFAINVPVVVAALVLVAIAVRPTPGAAGRHVDVAGAALAAVALAGVAFGLIEEPRFGWGSPAILAALAVGAGGLAAFVVVERRERQPMLPLALFGRRNFAVGNAETLAMYAALGVLFFFLVIFLQQVAGYSALGSGLATLPTTLVMFALSRRFGALADRIGPRRLMGVGPLVAAVGALGLLRVGRDVDYVTQLLPALLVFSIGLSMTVAPLTATVLADADESDAGIASAVNNAVARVAGLVGVSAAGLAVAGMVAGDTLGPDASSVRAFHAVVAACAGLLAAAGVAGLVGIVDPRRAVRAAECAGGQLHGAPGPAAAEAR